MPRPVIDEAQIHPAVRERVARHHHAVIEDVQRAVAAQRLLA
jgi:monothiol glutaredoxin